MRPLDKEAYADLKASGLCARCGNFPAVEQRTLCQTCREYARKLYLRQKKKVFDHYGRVCACCRFEFPEEFLTIDHVNNDGKQHRLLIKKNNLYAWLVRNHFPSDLQTLCWNCNGAKMANHGICPHQTKYQHLINLEVQYA